MRARVIVPLCLVFAVAGSHTALAGNKTHKAVKAPPRAVAFYAQVRKLVERHKWPAVLKLCDPQHLKTQRDMGMGDAQYIAELLGLHSVKNDISRGGKLGFAELGRIVKVVIKSYKVDRAGFVYAHGFVVLRNRAKLKLEMMARRLGTRYVLFGAVG